MGKDPEPSGVEGLADVRIIQAIYQSAQTGKPMQLDEFKRRQRPTAEQTIQRPAQDELPELVNTLWRGVAPRRQLSQVEQKNWSDLCR